jgi:endonuclease/exonuclease/phosphatase family metal-dependent hydrolase
LLCIQRLHAGRFIVRYGNTLWIGALLVTLGLAPSSCGSDGSDANGPKGGGSAGAAGAGVGGAVGGAGSSGTAGATGGGGSAVDAGIVDAAPPCKPSCGKRECGADGCQGMCGQCGAQESCTAAGWCLAPSDVTSAPPVRVMTLNLCGNNCPYTGVTPTTWATVVAKSMKDWKTDAALFTEMCYGQLQHLRTQLGGGWGYVWRSSHLDNAGCGKWGTDRRFGMAILAPHGATALPNRQIADLMPVPSCDDYNQRQLLCAEPKIDGVTTLTCVTHLTHKSGSCRVQQAQKVADLTASWSGGGPTILGGDFNAKPESADMDPLYAIGGGKGRYLEMDQEDPKWWSASCTGACRSGEFTFPASKPDRKIDFIFFSAKHFTSLTGDVLTAASGSATDHLTVRGAAVQN